MVIVSGAAAQVSRVGNAAPMPIDIWQDGSNSLWVIPCSNTDANLSGVTIEARKDGRATRAQSCYPSSNFVSVIWRRCGERRRRGASGRIRRRLAHHGGCAAHGGRASAYTIHHGGRPSSVGDVP
jgi:hypothetical protein